MREKLFHRDFTLVVIGQIISLLGNAVLRFVLPLYLLDITGSWAAWWRTVSISSGSWWCWTSSPAPWWP